MTLNGPDWPGVRYFCTTVAGGHSQGDWASLNLGEHCGDDPKHVAQNRAKLLELLPSAPHWLQQVHGTQIYRALRPAQQVAQLPYRQAPIADAAWTTVPNTVIGVLTADCLPVVIADQAGTVVGVAHAGWRGLAAGVVPRLFKQLQAQVAADASWQMWIGPAISQRHFEVGAEVRDAFVQKNQSWASYFLPSARPQKYYADLAGIAAEQIRQLAPKRVTVYYSGACTYAESERYFSYRRRANTGRMVTLAWLSLASG